MDRHAQNVSSILLQLSLSIHQVFLYAFVAVTIAIFIYKGTMLPYPPTGALTWEVIFLVLYYVIASTRLFQASKGNKTKQMAALVLSLLLAIPVIVCNVYYVQLQTYVLRLDLILNGIALFLVSWESLLSILTILALSGRSGL